MSQQQSQIGKSLANHLGPRLAVARAEQGSAQSGQPVRRLSDVGLSWVFRFFL